jgi:hypothetical protein
MLEKNGHAFLSLPPDSLDFNLIEQTFGVFKRRHDYAPAPAPAPAGTAVEQIVRSSGSCFK